MVITKLQPFTKEETEKLNDNNTSNEIQDPNIRKVYEELTKFFFQEDL